MDKSILTNFGGQGCIFNPSIPCKNEKKTKRKKKKKKGRNRNNKYLKSYFATNPLKENLK